MGRLIREQDVKQEIDKWLDSVGTAYVGKGLSYYGELLGCIEDAPTAYDIETVVAELEKESVEVFGHINVIGLNKAIEIVRSGGVK